MSLAQVKNCAKYKYFNQWFEGGAYAGADAFGTRYGLEGGCGGYCACVK